MAISETTGAPYAPPADIIEIVGKYRDVGLEKPFTYKVLQRCGVKESLCPRVMASLKQLELLDDNLNPTPIFDAIKAARGDEYQTRLQEWLRDVYSPVFAYADPTDPAAVGEAFRGYKPESQRIRMARLFESLLGHAGLIETPIARRRRTAAAAPKASSPKARAPMTARDKKPPKSQSRPGTDALDSSNGNAGRDQYLSLLLKKADAQDNPEDALLDRIERVLGLEPQSEH